MGRNALFQLVTGLGSPSTSRKEDFSIATSVAAHTASVESEQRNDHFVVRNGIRCAGVHLIIDLYEAERLDDLDHIEATLRSCVDAAGATLLHIHLHHFEPNGGISGVAVLAESHISIHSWPELGYAALDVFMCGNAEPEKCVPVLRQAFNPKQVAVSELMRGQGA
ncbi:MAG TPA: adenosylmethionine decarboxylase [Xanthobacteraceae bacterium]|jgi:S-adenosylmethionine decarboxylase|nr:adenosylmethionine decarboxylase [Xanthobacteraceae bacterium]